MRYRIHRYLVMLVLLLGVTNGCNAYAAIHDNSLNRIRDASSKYIKTLPSKPKARISSIYLPKEYEFILFYESGCKHCLTFSPVLKKYSVNTGIKIISFILGEPNDAMPLFSDSTQVDQKTVELFFGKGAEISTPALFIWNKNNGHVYPVSRGMHTYFELEVRMDKLIPRMLKHEKDLLILETKRK
jgi:hypothetical protein